MNTCISKENKIIHIPDHFWRSKQSRHVSLLLASVLALKLHCKSVRDLSLDKHLHELIHSLQISDCFGSKRRRHYRTEDTGNCTTFQIKNEFSIPV